MGLAPYVAPFAFQTPFSSDSDRNATRGRYVTINIANESLISSHAVWKLFHVCTFNHLENTSISSNPSRL
jgi:flavin reductase (DIM6/NTAB) family NADH-FMN oxidoreductase RutF